MSESEQSIEELLREARDYLYALANESDRGAAVLAAAQFERDLEDAIARRLGIAEFDESSKSRRGALKRWIRSFAAKIDVAYAVGLCERNTHKGLRTVVNIRNEFAHSMQPLSFEHRAIADLCLELETKVVLEGPRNLRRRYLVFLAEAGAEILLSSLPVRSSGPGPSTC